MMRYCALVLIIYLSAVSCVEVKNDVVIEDSRNYGLNWEEPQCYKNYNPDRERERIRRLDKEFGYTGPTANDDYQNIIRPCALNDWHCIRKFFASNGQCTPVHGPIPDPLILDVNTIYLPCVNLSITFTDYSIRGLSSARVRDFYVNKKSWNTVLALDIKDFNMTSPRAYFRYHRAAKESIVTADTSTAIFRSITFTIIIPKEPNLRLDKADSHFYIDDGIPKFEFGPNSFTSTDPVVIAAYTQLRGPLLPACVRESFMFQPQIFATMFIQNAICDFGIRLTLS